LAGAFFFAVAISISLIKLQRAPQKSSSTFAAIHHPGFVQPFGCCPDAVNGGAVIGFGSFCEGHRGPPPASCHPLRVLDLSRRAAGSLTCALINTSQHSIQHQSWIIPTKAHHQTGTRSRASRKSCAPSSGRSSRSSTETGSLRSGRAPRDRSASRDDWRCSAGSP